MKHLFATGRYSGGLWHIQTEGSMKQWMTFYHGPDGKGEGISTQYRHEAESKYKEWAAVEGRIVLLVEMMDSRPSEVIRDSRREAAQEKEAG